jgi:hypothetical protein
MDSGNLHVYCVQALCEEFNKVCALFVIAIIVIAMYINSTIVFAWQPPAPLVKILKSNRMADTTTSTDNSKKESKRRAQVTKSTINEDSRDVSQHFKRNSSCKVVLFFRICLVVFIQTDCMRF